MPNPKRDPQIDVHLDAIEVKVDAAHLKVAELQAYLADEKREMTPEQVQRFVEIMAPLGLAGASMLNEDLGRTSRRESSGAG